MRQGALLGRVAFLVSSLVLVSPPGPVGCCCAQGQVPWRARWVAPSAFHLPVFACFRVSACGSFRSFVELSVSSRCETSSPTSSASSSPPKTSSSRYLAVPLEIRRAAAGPPRSTARVRRTRTWSALDLAPPRRSSRSTRRSPAAHRTSTRSSPPCVICRFVERSAGDLPLRESRERRGSFAACAAAGSGPQTHRRSLRPEFINQICCNYLFVNPKSGEYRVAAGSTFRACAPARPPPKQQADIHQPPWTFHAPLVRISGPL